MRQAGRVFHIGVDLAWGTKRPTGLAVLDDGGRLVHVSTALTDEEIESTLAPYVADECLVAIDAPLIVRNATGNRPAEAALNRDFARFEAGAHPANTARPEVSRGPPAARPAAPLRLGPEPPSPAPPPAIEGLPHPAARAPLPSG